MKIYVTIKKKENYIASAHNENAKYLKIVKKCVFQYFLAPPENLISI